MSRYDRIKDLIKSIDELVELGDKTSLLKASSLAQELILYINNAALDKELSEPLKRALEGKIEHNISFDIKDDILICNLDDYLPKKKDYEGDSAFKLRFAYAAQEFFLKTHFRIGGRAVIVFEHHYDEESIKNMRDVDNMQSKDIVDVIAQFFLVDDSGDLLSIVHTAKKSRKNGTIIKVAKQEDMDLNEVIEYEI